LVQKGEHIIILVAESASKQVLGYHSRSNSTYDEDLVKESHEIVASVVMRLGTLT